MNQPLTDTAQFEHDQLIERLGFAGAIPFVVLSILLWLIDEDLHPFVSIALAAYGAVIVSFLGGIHWGVAFLKKSEHQRFHLIWGVTLSLLAWLAVLMPAFSGLPFLGFLLITAYLVDRKSYHQAGIKAYLTLRFRLTIVASICCFIAAGAT
jgi:hypothetical protein